MIELDLQGANTPQELFNWLERHIAYGWVDGEGIIHEDMKGFRREYHTLSLEEILGRGVGTCIDQVWLIHLALDRMGIHNKMFCCRIFEPDDYGNLEEEEHMHCFCLCQWQGQTLHIEHPNVSRKGIWTYPDETTAVQAIEDYYIQLRGGKKSPTTEFFTVESGLSFRQFNAYINSLDRSQGNLEQLT